jgi:ribose transport system substrate-binding protein
MTATVQQDPVAQGAGSVNLAIDVLNGKKPAEPIVRLPAQLIDKANVKDFM